MNSESYPQNVSVRLIQENRFEVRIGDQYQIGDSYYLGIAAADGEQSFDTAEGLRILLRSWLQVLTDASTQDISYLPFDFADEYTRWLACQKSDDQLLIVFGTAAVEGWAISPGNFAEFAHRLPEFQPDSPIVVHSFYRPYFLSQLRRSLAAVAGSNSAETGPKDA